MAKSYRLTTLEVATLLECLKTEMEANQENLRDEPDRKDFVVYDEELTGLYAKLEAQHSTGADL